MKNSEKEKEKKLALLRFVADGDGIKVVRKNPLPDWNSVLKEAKKEASNRGS